VTLSRPPLPGVVRAVYALVIGWIVAYEVHVIAAPALGVHGLFSKQVHLVVLVIATILCVMRAIRAREEARGWALIALGIGTWTAGEIYYTQVLWDADVIPVPSAADVGYLLLCPLWFAGFTLIARQRVRGTPRPSGWTGCARPSRLAPPAPPCLRPGRPRRRRAPAGSRDEPRLPDLRPRDGRHDRRGHDAARLALRPDVRAAARRRRRASGSPTASTWCRPRTARTRPAAPTTWAGG
jgi:hypothetical protein